MPDSPTPSDRAPRTREELKRLWEATTPGTWYDHNVDDDMCMNVYAVTTSPNEPDLDSPVDSQNDHAVVVALTLLQSPRLACHASEKWAEDARFIATAHNAFGSLLAALEAAEASNRWARAWKQVAKQLREALFDEQTDPLRGSPQRDRTPEMLIREIEKNVALQEENERLRSAIKEALDEYDYERHYDAIGEVMARPLRAALGDQ